jgi:hypothetical protein
MLFASAGSRAELGWLEASCAGCRAFSACSRNSKAPGLIRPGQMGANECSLSLIAEKSGSDAQAYARYVWKATETLIFVCRPKKARSKRSTGTGTVDAAWRFLWTRWPTAMPRYYFHISNGKGSKAWNEGIDLPDKDAAWTEATAACGEIIRDLNGDLKPGDVWRMIVRDETGTEVFHLELSTRESR